MYKGWVSELLQGISINAEKVHLPSRSETYLVVDTKDDVGVGISRDVLLLVVQLVVRIVQIRVDLLVPWKDPKLIRLRARGGA